MGARKSKGIARPEILIFDVDGVLVDVAGSFHRSILDTIRHFTGRRATYREIHQWKNRPGYNDDWRLTTDWICSLGRKIGYEEVKRQFQVFYWGSNGDGNVLRERWLVTPARVARWAKSLELALFTGRTQQELRYTLERSRSRNHFRQIVTMDDVARPKPAPDGLLRILAGRDPASALYLGDNIDDALAAREARVPFLGVLPLRSEARRQRGARLRELGALGILHSVKELDAWLRTSR
jgi:HAD superfamily phosphatase